MTACVMAAPCALAVSKLSYPETKASKFKSADGLVLEKTYVKIIDLQLSFFDDLICSVDSGMS